VESAGDLTIHIASVSGGLGKHAVEKRQDEWFAQVCGALMREGTGPFLILVAPGASLCSSGAHQDVHDPNARPTTPMTSFHPTSPTYS